MEQQITLYYQGGSSDKYYAIGIDKTDAGYSVPFAYGRRLSTCQTGNKGVFATEQQAHNKYSKVLQEKLDKGYWKAKGPAYAEPELSPYDGSEYTIANIQVTLPEEKGTKKSYNISMSYKGSGKPAPKKEMSGAIPQQPTPIEESDVQFYINSPDYCAQEKFDGKHMTAKFEGNDVHTCNKLGKHTTCPISVITDCQDLAYFWKTDRYVIDGELIGETLWVYDLLELDGSNPKDATYEERYQMLVELGFETEHIKMAPIAKTREEKRALFKALKEQGREGIIFKRLSSVYTPGKTAGDFLKHKFYEEATCVVAGVNKKRSIRLSMWDSIAERWEDVGNCTIPPNKDVPEEGEYVEIRYLYAYKGGCLYQPTFKCVRDDVVDTDCDMNQLKYKCGKTEAVAVEVAKTPVRRIQWE